MKTTTEQNLPVPIGIPRLYKIRLMAEWVILFFGVPLILSQNWITLPGRFGKLILLFAATLICLIYLLWDKSFNNLRLCGLAKVKLIWKPLVIRTLLCAVLLLALCALFYPKMLFGLIKYNPRIWIMVFVFYPFLSAWPQELIYRSFMFQRYKKIFGDGHVMLIASAVAFAFLHVIYLNWIAIGMTLIAGYIFAVNYKKTSHLATCALEHAVYGNLIFTIGFGMFFFRVM